MYSFLEVLVRLQKIDLALKICDYVLNCAPKNFHSQFKKKQEWFIGLHYKNKLNKLNKLNKQQTTKANKEHSEFGLKLKEALKKKK